MRLAGPTGYCTTAMNLRLPWAACCCASLALLTAPHLLQSPSTWRRKTWRWAGSLSWPLYALSLCLRHARAQGGAAAGQPPLGSLPCPAPRAHPHSSPAAPVPAPSPCPPPQPLEGGDRRIVHRALDSYFDSFSPALGRYIPSRKLQVRFCRCAACGWLVTWQGDNMPCRLCRCRQVVPACAPAPPARPPLAAARCAPRLAESPLHLPGPQFEYPDSYSAEDCAPVGDDSNIMAQVRIGQPLRLRPSFCCPGAHAVVARVRIGQHRELRPALCLPWRAHGCVGCSPSCLTSCRCSLPPCAARAGACGTAAGAPRRL